jgi:hypothetical protein
MHSRIETLLAAVLIAAVLATGGIALARDDTRAAAACSPAAPVASDAAGARDFAGTVVDLSCDVVRPPGGIARCDAGEHYFALRIDGERGLRPLQVVGGSAGAERLNAGELTGREVCVTAERSPAGVLLVNEIHPLG